MMFRVIGYFVLLVVLIIFDLLMISKKQEVFSVVWKKTTLYSLTFVIYIILCYLLDYVLIKLGI
ncbi:MAG: hypothetical protein U0L18_05450 [Acutalibacteraceae bacterium]|nr:hypothetical protein [Acutalibacteraceae bacterium]